MFCRRSVDPGLGCFARNDARDCGRSGQSGAVGTSVFCATALAGAAVAELRPPLARLRRSDGGAAWRAKMIAIWVRFWRRYLRMMLPICARTVFSEILSSYAMFLFCIPRAISIIRSRSRGVGVIECFGSGLMTAPPWPLVDANTPAYSHSVLSASIGLSLDALWAG